METSAPLRVAVVGSGPSGFYAADALLRPGAQVRVDIFERLPTPFGLVRGGVAPDHPKIKSVAAVYERTAADPRLRFFGGVRAGSEVPVEELSRLYHAVVLAVGCEGDRALGVPGEDLPGSWSATEFVGWYNGHPDHRDKSFDLSADSAAVVGVGNVAVDVARILASDPERLAATDIAEHALAALRASRVRTVHLLGRRGPAEAAYSAAELAELAELPGTDLLIRPEEAALGEAAPSDPAAAKKAALARELAARPASGAPRRILLRFCVSPVEILGANGRVRGLRLERNRLVADGRGGARAEGTGAFEELAAGLALRSVGYRGRPLPGVPFDERAGHIPHEGGRVVALPGRAPVPGLFVVGWAKRGPSGLIGTNKADSAATVRALLEDAAAGRLPEPLGSWEDAAPSLLARRGVRPLSFEDWRTLDRLERERGRAAGKPREKFTRVPEMLAALGSP